MTDLRSTDDSTGSDGFEHRSSIAFLGDSITAGGDWQAWFPDRHAHNLGVPGNTTADVIDRIDEVLALRPDAVALLIGANDLGQRKSVEHLVRNIEYLLVTLRRGLPGARMLVQSIMPCGPSYAERVHEANRHLRQFSPSVNAQYLDLWPTLGQENGELKPGLSTDGIHLSAEGYEAWLSELRPGLERLDDAPPMSRPIQIIREP